MSAAPSLRNVLDRVTRVRQSVECGEPDREFALRMLAALEHDLALSIEHPCADATAGWRALMLAPTVELYNALLAGEAVPLSALRQEWVRRFGLRGSR